MNEINVKHKFVEITNRKALRTYLLTLKEETPAKWGKMDAQDMVEHLGNTLQMTNGKRIATLRVSEEEAAANKERFIYTSVEMPLGIKSSSMGENPDPYKFSSLHEAIVELQKQLDDFEFYFANNPEATFIHPRHGALNHSEWIIFHNKHFTHHFKQFGLLHSEM